MLGKFSAQNQLPGKQPLARLLPALGEGRGTAESLGWYFYSDSCSGAVLLHPKPWLHQKSSPGPRAPAP